MADIVANVAKGRIAAYASLTAANDALIVIPLETTGLVSDATLRDYDTVSDMLAGATNEQTTMGRKTVTSATVTVNDTTDTVDIDIADQTWTGATGNAISKLCIAYDPDTTGGTDADLVPLGYYDFVATPDGTNLTAQFHATGILQAG